ncbi:malignant fibrous histiocytoma-amplified sequence 1 homolog [Watersipora subatra]|uniref:malignant fibrous histiocytoma-amplified sequence 1 homolog n=1 Tax=Watersipora subatra TaxID=2589382 RepID=UPI00355B42A0
MVGFLGYRESLGIALPSLHELSLTSCNLTKPPQSLRSLHQLKTFKITECDFHSDFLPLLSDLSSLVKLSLLHFPLADLPESLSALTQLKVLEFSTHRRSSRDNCFKLEVIAKLTSLEELRVHNSYGISLPMSLSTLESLKSLDLHSISFNDKSNSKLLGRMTSLQQLKVTDCNSNVLPKHWLRLPRLKKLDLSSTRGDEALDFLSRFPILEELNLSDCQLKPHQLSLSTLKVLKTLNISGNVLYESFPDVINDLTLLERLDISQCAIPGLPMGFGKLTNLKQLDLSYNGIMNSSIDAITMLRSLEELNLENNKLEQLPDSYYSLQSLKKLKKLNLSSNSFTNGLPEVLGGLRALEDLDLHSCKLTQLPVRLRGLRELRKLDISENNFEELPSFLYEFENLEELNISCNLSLKSIEKSIRQSKSLRRVDCHANTAMLHPPYSVCKQGLSAISEFFYDLEFGASQELAIVSVAVVGNSLSGKTSLLRSLQKGRRHLTFREESSPQDETTRVFEVEDLPLRATRIKMIDYGGHEIYHIAYHILIKDRCIPLVVVNLSEFVNLSVSKGPREACRRVFFDWVSHLYLACPKLGPPILSLTHTDELLSGEQVQQARESLLTVAEELRKEILKEEEKDLEQFPDKAVRWFQNIEHLANTELPIVCHEDIFEFNNDCSITSNIALLKKNLENRCNEFVLELPRLWELTEDYLELQWQQPFIALSDVEAKFTAVNPTTILRYMHNSGKILWLENVPELSGYIFHQFAPIRQAINLLFHHSSEEQWKKSLSLFEPFLHNGQPIKRHEYATFLQAFLSSGVLDEALLVRLLKDSALPYDVAVKLLRCLFILHGPVEQNHRQVFLVPCLSSTFMDDSWKTDGQLQLRMEMLIRGLSLPKYVFQLMSVAMLKESFILSEKIHFTKNGTTIRQKLGATHLVHDCNAGRVTLQVSTSVEFLGNSWKHLLSSASTICKLLFDVWKVCRIDARIYCACCLFRNEPNPAHEDNPDWFRFMLQTKDAEVSKVSTYSGLDRVFCHRCAATNTDLLQDGVHTPFRFPCYNLTDAEIQSLDEFLCILQPSSPAVTKAEQDKGTSYPSREDVESDVSDVETEGYCDETKSDKVLQLKLELVRKPKVKKLYRNVEKVYQLADRERGRALIINIMNFANSKESRLGSDVDYKNLSKLFKDLRLTLVKTEEKLTDLTAEDIFREIKEETQREEHECLSMFVLVIMSHGQTGDMILDSKGHPFSLADIKNMLSPLNFPSMAGKPKLLIIQACSGEKADLGNLEVRPSPSRIPTHLAEPANKIPASSKPIADENSGLPSFQLCQDVSRSQPPTLNVDDFLVMKASSESYTATRSTSHGSWFIRVLVATLYRHSCHRDVETLFKIIQDRVRKLSLRRREHGTGGNVPTADCTFTNMRKLYFFPKFPSR